MTNRCPAAWKALTNSVVLTLVFHVANWFMCSLQLKGEMEEFCACLVHGETLADVQADWYSPFELCLISNALLCVCICPEALNASQGPACSKKMEVVQIESTTQLRMLLSISET